MTENAIAENAAGLVEEETTPEELTQLIQEFETYRERLVTDMTDAAQKAKMSKKAMMAQLEPELQQIDEAIAHLKDRLAAIG